MKILLLENPLNSELWIYYGIFSEDEIIKEKSLLKAL
jgi:hypothetical protein